MKKLDIQKMLDRAGGCILAPSLLSADFGRLNEDIARAKIAGADLLHLDIMDGHFVPNISFGPPVIESIGKSPLPMEAHLMISDPIKYGKKFVELGAIIITAHIEVLKTKAEWSNFRKEMKIPVGIAINPPTPLKDAAPLVEMFELILIMSVNPGFSGQKFMPIALRKIEAIAKEASRQNVPRFIAVDGGINEETSRLVRDAGANFIVAGNAFFKSKNYSVSAKKLKWRKK